MSWVQLTLFFLSRRLCEWVLKVGRCFFFLPPSLDWCASAPCWHWQCSDQCWKHEWMNMLEYCKLRNKTTTTTTTTKRLNSLYWGFEWCCKSGCELSTCCDCILLWHRSVAHLPLHVSASYHCEALNIQTKQKKTDNVWVPGHKQWISVGSRISSEEKKCLSVFLSSFCSAHPSIPLSFYALFLSLSLSFCVCSKTCQAGDLYLIQHPDTRCVRQTRCQSLHMQ